MLISALFLLCGVTFWSLGSFAQAYGQSGEVQIEVDPILREGSPADLLLEDLAVPVYDVGQAGARGVKESLPIPTTDLGRSGGMFQVRGFGRSSEETGILIFGVPANPPQGGGFDFASFPQYLWSGFRFQPGASSAVFDPKAMAGSLTLIPWTSIPPKKGLSQNRVTGFFSGGAAEFDPGLGEFSVATRQGSMAGVAGWSLGGVRGPGGGMSVYFGGERTRGAFHWIAADLEAKSLGSQDAPTPHATQRSTRVIPVVQLDSRVGSTVLVKSNLYLDWGQIRYTDTDWSGLPLTSDRIQQLGSETAILLGESQDWKLGLSAKRIRYSRLGFIEQDESILSFLVSKIYEIETWFLEPQVRATAVTGSGLLPEGSFGFRKEWSRGPWLHTALLRAGFSRRFPSLLNRYYDSPGFPPYPAFAGNPGLRPERVWSLTTGWEVADSSGNWIGRLLFLMQRSEEAQVRTRIAPLIESVLNQGSAQMASVGPSLSWTPSAHWNLASAWNLSRSFISETGQRYPGVSDFQGFFAVTTLFSGAARPELGLRFRGGTSFLDPVLQSDLPGYGLWGLTGKILVFSGPQATLQKLEVSMSVDNLWDRPVQLVAGYPQGRQISVGLIGEF